MPLFYLLKCELLWINFASLQSNVFVFFFWYNSNGSKYKNILLNNQVLPWYLHFYLLKKPNSKVEFVLDQVISISAVKLSLRIEEGLEQLWIIHGKCCIYLYFHQKFEKSLWLQYSISCIFKEVWYMLRKNTWLWIKFCELYFLNMSYFKW